jgi:hypothetical protein
MSVHDRDRLHIDHSTLGRVTRALALAVVAALFTASCEDKGLGRPCGDIQDAGPLQGAYTTMASDCPSRICNKPGVQPGVSTDLDTGPYCTIQCTSDNDCNGETRDATNKLDRRCKKGFTCAIPYDVGALCCTKLCLCRDFVSNAGPIVPEACTDDTATCSK